MLVPLPRGLAHKVCGLQFQTSKEREKQLFYQMTLTISLVGSLLVALVYIHNSQGKGQKEEVKTGGLTDLIIPAMCPASPTESLGLGSITEEGDTALSKHSLREENKILRNQLELMRAIGPNGVIHEDQEYDGSVLSDASISVDQGRRWWRFGIRPQQPRQHRPIVKGLDRVKADAAASSGVSNQLDTAPAGVTDDGESSVIQPQPRWGWGRRKTDEDVSSKDKSSSSSTGDEASDDDRSQVSLSSMGISASIDYQLKMMSENCSE